MHHFVTHPLRGLIAAIAGAGLLAGITVSPASAAAATDVTFSFDFGGPATPVAAGWTGVNPGTTYSAARGYGFTNAPLAGGFRDRGGNDLLARDFTIGAGSAFAVDLPNGSYEVTTWAGDLTAGNTTDFDVEGMAFAGPRTASGVIHQEVFAAIPVTDGQLNVRVTGGDGRINGIRVRSHIPSPSGLTASVDTGTVQIALAWEAAADATGYVIYRSAPNDELQEVARVGSDPTYVDTTVALGGSYEYSVAALRADRLSAQSARVSASVRDESVPIPATPSGVSVTGISRNEIELAWNDASDALQWKILRSTRADLPFEEIGTATGPGFTDTSVLTTRPYLYQVVAQNLGGLSAPSDTLATEVATTLVRQVEYLDRAPVAVKTGGGIYVGWRLFGLDEREVAFDVYRDGARITASPIIGSTNIVDPSGTLDSTYFVTAHIDARDVTVTDEFGVWAADHLDIPLNKPADLRLPDGKTASYWPGDGTVGDLDGDGQYEMVFLWNPSVSKDNSQSGYTGNVYAEAVKFDGTSLWRIDLGRNIRAGAHYTQLEVFDFDGDGKAEVAFKTADGTTDGVGNVIGSAAADHRNSSGYILNGPEFLSVFDGETGSVIDSVNYAPARGSVASWGDTYGNRVDRFLAGVAYLDGEHPSLITSRGYYTRTVIVAWDLVDGKLVQRWTFDTNQAGAQFEGQGNHQFVPADVDRDGLDEIVFGSLTIDDDGTPLYNTGLRHGDALHVSDFVTDRDGLEVYAVHEVPTGNGGIIASMRDAETGAVIWSNPGALDTGRGTAADIDPASPGAESWNIDPVRGITSGFGTLNAQNGEVLSTEIPAANFVTWWDGDLTREITDHDYNESTTSGVPTIGKWNPATQRTVELKRLDGTRTNNTTKGNPVLQADLLGDWREELAVRLDDGSGIRIYTTTDVTAERIPTLMHDSQYRLAVAGQNSAYNQPPHPSFFLGAGMTEPPIPSIRYSNPPAADESAPEVSGLPSGTTSGALQLAIRVSDEESGVRSQATTIGGQSVAPDELVDMTARELAGEVDVVVTATNHAGLTTEKRSTILVVPADGAASRPSQGTLSHTSGWANGLHDGNFDVVMNLWWGTPGTVFRLYENGVLVSTRLLTANGMSQTTGATFTGKPNGTYVYTAELINSRGATATTSTTVVVTHAAPAAPTVSHDNWDGDGAFVAVADLWWGTNATAYRFELDGVVVASGALIARTPQPQKATAPISGVTPGLHSLIAVFSNPNGNTSSVPVEIRVN